MRKLVGILGTPIDRLDTPGVLARLEQFIRERRFHQVATANTDFLINALDDPELRHILQVADLIMPDGMPVVWAARAMRSPLPERVTGADIVPLLAATAPEKGYRVYMLGARAEIAQRARVFLEANNPGLQIVGCVSPPMGTLIEMDSEAILADIAHARPDILFVAFGNPKQEKWIHMHRDRLCDVPVCMGVGGTFDFLAGESKRAPLWMQNHGLEWAYRLAQNPRRLWRRYTRDFVHFGRYLVEQCWSLRSRSGARTTDIHLAETSDCTVLSVVGDLDNTALPQFESAACEALDSRTNLVIDLHGVTTFDGATLGALINLPKRAAHCGREVRLVSVPPPIQHALRCSHLDDGLYQVAASVAQAFAVPSCDVLTWRIQSGASAAVVTVQGVSDHATGLQLEAACRRLLAGGKQVDLDTRAVGYVDSFFLSVCYRLSHAFNAGMTGPRARFRIVPGATVRYAMTQERLLERFALRQAPDLPLDAVEQAPEAPMMRLVDTDHAAAVVEARPAFAPGAP